MKLASRYHTLNLIDLTKYILLDTKNTRLLISCNILFQAPAYYNFNWLVKDDPSYNNYGQSESRNGDKTEGSYCPN